MELQRAAEDASALVAHLQGLLGVEPDTYVDLVAFEGVSDREVAWRLGARDAQKVEYFTPYIAEERAGSNDERLHGRRRCNAGRSSLLDLRCIEAALPLSKRCGMKAHKEVAQPAQSKGVATARLVSAVEALTGRLEMLAEKQERIVAEMRSVAVENARLTSVLECAGVHSRGTELHNAGWLNAAQVAAKLGVSRALVYRLARSGELPSSRIGSQLRFKPVALDKWLDKRSRGPRR